MISPPEEVSLSLTVNGVELVTIQCSPFGFDDLGVGFLYTNGVISNFDEIEASSFSRADCALRFELGKKEFPMPRRFVVTSGFGGGPVFDDGPPGERVGGAMGLPADRLAGLMAAMKDRAVHYQNNGGIHATALCEGGGVVYMAEDVGRQNSMDKVIGHCLSRGIELEGKAMLTTGRISFEMVAKAVRAGIPVLASLSAPTKKAVEHAGRCGVAIAGYVDDDGFIAYSHEQRFMG